VSAGLAYSLYRLHVRPTLCRTSASEVAVLEALYASVVCLCHTSLPLRLINCRFIISIRSNI